MQVSLKLSDAVFSDMEQLRNSLEVSRNAFISEAIKERIMRMKMKSHFEKMREDSLKDRSELEKELPELDNLSGDMI